MITQEFLSREEKLGGRGACLFEAAKCSMFNQSRILVQLWGGGSGGGHSKMPSLYLFKAESSFEVFFIIILEKDIFFLFIKGMDDDGIIGTIRNKLSGT